MTAMANFKRNVLLRNIQSFLMPSLSNGTSHILPQFTWHCGRRALCTVFPANLLNLYFKSCRQFKCLEKASSFSKSREAVMYHVHVHVHPQFEIEDALRNYATFFLFFLVFFFSGRLSMWYILQRRGLSSAQSGWNFMNFIWNRNWFSFCRIEIVKKLLLPWHRYFQPFYLFKFQPLPAFYLS